jgi:hypothetical protein
MSETESVQLFRQEGKDFRRRDELLEVCRAFGADVNEVAQALVAALQITLIMVGPDDDSAERNIRRIADDMLNQIHQSYREFHEMAESRRHLRQ